MDAMALCNSAINFILYCSMSRQFRTTFSVLFRPKILDRWLPVPQGEDGFDRTHGGRPDNGHTTQVTQVQQLVRRPREAGTCGATCCIRALCNLFRGPSAAHATTTEVTACALNNNNTTAATNLRCVTTALQCRRRCRRLYRQDKVSSKSWIVQRKILISLFEMSPLQVNFRPYQSVTQVCKVFKITMTHF